MCWVMPPNSLSVIFEERMASSSEVLPWSTWPMIVTTGRARRAAGRAPGARAPARACSWTSSSKVTTIASTPSSSASFCASSGSSTWLMLATMPRSNSTLIRSRAFTPSLSANSRSVMPSESVIAPAGASFLKVSTLPASSSAFFWSARRRRRAVISADCASSAAAISCTEPT